MKIWLLLPILFLLCVIPSHAAISVVSHSYIPQATGCSNGLGQTTCTFSDTISNTGDTAVFWISTCVDVACTQTITSFSASDGTNTWTQVPGAVFQSAKWNVVPFVCNSTTAGTYTVTVSYSGGTGTGFYYSRIWKAELSGAYTASPIDASVSNTATGSSAGPSITSSRNVLQSNDLVIAIFNATPNVSNTGSYSTIDGPSNADGFLGLDLANPLAGSPTTAAITSGNGTYWASILAFQTSAPSPTIAIGQSDQAASTSSNAQVWPGCASSCMSSIPSYAVIPGSTRRIWTNVCAGTNAWGGTGYPSEVPNCLYPASVSVTWNVSSGNCTVTTPSSVYTTLTCPGSISATELDTITATTVATPTASVTIHVLVVVPAADALTNSASMALHYCGVTGVATCTYVAPFYEVLYKGQYADVQAFVSGRVNTKVTWSVSPNNGGLTILNSVSNRDLAVQAVNAGTYTLTATSVADGTSSAAAKIVVTSNFLTGQTRTSKVMPIDCTAEGSGTTYDATDDASFGAVPWDTLTAGDTVRIHAKASLVPYAIPFQIKTSGTATQPIRICGIPDGSGNLPILTGNNAGQGNVTVAQQPYGMVVLVSINGQSVNCSLGVGCSQPPEPDTHNVIIEGLKIESAYSVYSRSGGAAAWQQGATCIRVEARDIVLRGNDCSDSSDGFFVGSTTTLGESRITRRLAVEGNTMYNNGESGSSSFHNNYLQGDMLVFQWNWVGQVGHGGQGDSVKSRMAYPVIRYNYIQGSSRTIDLVELQDWPDLGIPGYFYADNQPSGNPGDPTGIADVASVAEHIQTTYIYGNVLDDNSTLPGGAPGNPVHYFCDVFGNAEQGGIDYYYGNTQREIHDGTGTYADNVFIWDSTTGQCGVPQVWPRWELTNNVMDIECATAGCGNGVGWFSPTPAYQDIAAVDKNWFTTGWNTTATGSGPSTSWLGCCSSPTDNGNSCYQNTCQDNSGTNHISGETNIVTGATVPFNSITFVPINGSPLLSATTTLPAAVLDMPPEFNYEPDNQAISVRADLSANFPTTLGALSQAGGISTNSSVSGVTITGVTVH